LTKPSILDPLNASAEGGEVGGSFAATAAELEKEGDPGPVGGAKDRCLEGIKSLPILVLNEEAIFSLFFLFASNAPTFRPTPYAWAALFE
jgi:hypothetical protein